MINKIFLIRLLKILITLLLKTRNVQAALMKVSLLYEGSIFKIKELTIISPNNPK